MDWIDRVNAPLSAKELALLRVSVERGRHFGVEECVKRTASELGLGHTARPEGRPPKPRNWLRPCFRPPRFGGLHEHICTCWSLDPDVAQGWSDEDIVRCWGRLFPPRDKSPHETPESEEWVQARLKDARWVATARERLQSLSWFMKCLKEPLSRLANREEQTRGAFFEGRFKNVAILDEESLLATCAYIELNRVAAGGDGNGDAASITEIAALRSAPAHAKGSAKSTGRVVGAGLVARAEDWRWSGLWARNHGDDAIKAIFSPWPVERQVDWIDRVNAPLSAKELALLRVSVERGRHFGVEECVKRTASELGLGHTVRPEGRPPKPRNRLRPCFRPATAGPSPHSTLVVPSLVPRSFFGERPRTSHPRRGWVRARNPRLEPLPSVAFMARPALPGRPQIA